jgi:hypothetical protein
MVEKCSNSEIEKRILQKPDFRSRLKEFELYYSIIKCAGRVYTRNDDGGENIRLFCACANCMKEPANAALFPEYSKQYSDAVVRLRNFINSNVDYPTKLKYWIEVVGDPILRIQYGDESITINPKDPVEIGYYNRFLYEFYRNSEFEYARGSYVYSQGENLLSRVKRYESQMATALYPSNLRDKTIKEVQAEFGTHWNRHVRDKFQSLVDGEIIDWKKEPWHFDDCIYMIDANEGYMFLKYLETKITNMIKPAFLIYASDILADTDQGYSWSQIVKYFVAKSAEFNVDIPYSDVKFPNDGSIPNKRTGFAKNLEAFSPVQQYEIIEELASKKPEYEKTHELLSRLKTQYSAIEGSSKVATNTSIQKAKGLLHKFPRAEHSYNSALEKIAKGIYERNALDDLRLSLELLINGILGNGKSLENQRPFITDFFKNKGVTPEIANLFWQLIDHYTKYQNNNVKHNDKVNPDDVDLILNLTTAFINRIIVYA